MERVPPGDAQRGNERGAEAKPKSYAKASNEGEGFDDGVPSSVKLLASLAKAMKKAEVHLAEGDGGLGLLQQEEDDDAERCVALLTEISSEATGGGMGVGGVPLQSTIGQKQQDQEVSRDEDMTTDTSDAAAKSDDALSEEVQVVPQLKQKKKLSRQHSTGGMKYAPGDYTEVPTFMAPPVQDPDHSLHAFPGADHHVDQLPYSLYVISGAVDSRLLVNLGLTAELELQCTARWAYESILWALALAKPLASATTGGGDAPPQGKKPAGGDECPPDLAQCAEATGMLLTAIECALERAKTSHCMLDVVPLLELWVWLNSLEWHSGGPAAQKGVVQAESGAPQQSNGTVALGVFSERTLGLLMDLVLTTLSLNLDTRLCHLVIALFHSVLRHLKARAGGSSSFDFVVDVEKFSRVLFELCLSWPECNASDGPILASFFTDLLCVKVVDCSGKAEPQAGILLLLDILSKIMQDE